jgi:hypothetical protein
VTSRDKAAVREEYTILAISGVKGSSGQLLASLLASQPDYALPAIQKRHDWWASVSKQYPLVTATARRVLALHATSAAAERNWSALGRQFPANRADLAVSTGMKSIYVKVNDGRAHEDVDKELVLSLIDEKRVFSEGSGAGGCSCLMFVNHARSCCEKQLAINCDMLGCSRT